LGYVLLLAAMAGCWRMFRAERDVALRNRQRSTELAAARSLAADPALRDAFLREAVRSLCRNREE
jgi:hypothetical protein